MKKFALLLCVSMSALIVPQGVWATSSINVSGTTLTVNSDNAGWLSSQTKIDAMKACTTIVLIGKFNASDLSSIQQSGSDFNATTVDMREAQFVQVASNSNDYQLFSGTAAGAGTQAVENAYLYRWVNTKAWNTSSAPAEGTTVSTYADIAARDADLDSRSIGDYGKIANGYRYMQMQIGTNQWNGPSTTSPSSYTPVDWLENDLESHKNEYSNKQSIRLKRWYHKEQQSGYWERVYPSPLPASAINGNHYGGGVNADINNLDANYCNDGEYIWFYKYYQKNSSGTWDALSLYDNVTTDPTTGDSPISLKADLDIAPTEATLNSDYNSGYSEGDIIRVKWYYVKHATYQWVQRYPTSSELEGKTQYDGVAVGADMSNLIGSIGAPGSYIWFNLYYTKNDSREWINEQTTCPDGYTDDQIPLASFEYAYRNNHKAGYANGDWVKMPYNDYYKVELTGTPHWELVTYSDGETYPISKFFDSVTTIETLNNGSNNGSNVGEYAVVGGPKKSYINNVWTDYNSSATVPDYSQMKFTYWKSSITKAITSKYADGTIPNEIFQECYSLTNIEYLGGVVKGLNDHSPSQYANYEIFIGKDVTEIASAAFNQSRSLTKVTFDKDYSSLTEAELANYPKPLTIGDNAFNDCNYLLEVEIPNRTISIGNNAFAKVGNANIDINDVEKDANKNREFKLSFERRCYDDGLSAKAIPCSFPLTIGESAFQDCFFLKHLSLPIRLENLGNNAFKNSVQLKELEMRETTNCPYTPTDTHHLLKTIPDGAFSGSHVEEVTIPKSVTLIENNAFGSTNHLAKVTFQMQDGSPQEPLVIKSGAFTGGDENIIPNLHVYVDIDPTQRKIVCEYNAFNFTQMEGQTAENNERRGTLHFNKDYWDYYQGDWKRGLTFSQSNLNAFKDGYNGTYTKDVNGEETTITLVGMASESNRDSDTDFAAGVLNGIYTYGLGTNEEYAPANGWQQFAGTSTGIDLVIPGGTFIRTYSTTTTYDIPKAMINLVETEIVKVYRVTNFTDGYTGQDVSSGSAASSATRKATALLVVNTSTNEPTYIPKNTGLIMKGNVDSGSGYLTYFKERDTNVNEPEYPYEQITSETKVNLLVPTNDGTVTLNPTDPYPIGTITESNQGSRYRIFGFHKTDHYFARVQPNVRLGKNRAYMKLPASLFHWANEPKTGNDTDYIESGSSARILLSFGDETDSSDITEIRNVNSNSIDDDCFYTIQGVKLSQPQGSGLYIHKGRKIFVR